MTNSDICELNAMVTHRLASMWDHKEQLCCRRLILTGQGPVSDGLPPRCTIMALLGFRELERVGGGSGFESQLIFERFIRDTGWIGFAGDLGLLMWLAAEFAPEQLKGLFLRLECATALDRYPDAKQARTTEMSWFLAGVSHAALASPQMIPELTDIAADAYHLLEENQGESGLFGHASRRKSLSGFFKGRIGNFADQIYPIYALSKFATAFNVNEPLAAALKCARALHDTDGESSQWSWLYDSRTGKEVSRYPAYPVHQHGTAPLGFIALEEASGQNFQQPIYKGFKSISGNGTHGEYIRDIRLPLTWQGIGPAHRLTNLLREAQSLLRGLKTASEVMEGNIIFDHRPCELGLLLYAFAGYLRKQATSAV